MERFLGLILLVFMIFGKQLHSEWDLITVLAQQQYLSLSLQNIGPDKYQVFIYSQKNTVVQIFDECKLDESKEYPSYSCAKEQSKLTIEVIKSDSELVFWANWVKDNSRPRKISEYFIGSYTNFSTSIQLEKVAPYEMELWQETKPSGQKRYHVVVSLFQKTIDEFELCDGDYAMNEQGCQSFTLFGQQKNNESAQVMILAQTNETGDFINASATWYSPDKADFLIRFQQH